MQSAYRPMRTTKLIWVVIIVFGHLIGALIYLAMGKPDSSFR
jgi:hypothetical protein